MELKLVRVEIIAIAWTMKKGDSSSHCEVLMFRLPAVVSGSKVK